MHIQYKTFLCAAIYWL